MQISPLFLLLEFEKKRCDTFGQGVNLVRTISMFSFSAFRGGQVGKTRNLGVKVALIDWSRKSRSRSRHLSTTTGNVAHIGRVADTFHSS